jgi:hypothetical protein
LSALVLSTTIYADARQARSKKVVAMHRLVNVLVLAAVAALPTPARVRAVQTPASQSAAQNPQAWPRQVTDSTGSVILYEPQLEKVTANTIEGRAAVQVTKTGSTPAFGAVWMSARVDIDRDARLVTFRDIRVPRVRIVDASDADKAALAQLLEQQMPTWNLQLDLDQFIPLLAVADHDTPTDIGLKNDPPKIVVTQEPTTLVVLDGSPRQQAMTTPAEAAQAKLERIVNTPALIVYHPTQRSYYLAGGGDLWYSASQATGPYAPATNVPAVVAGLVPKPEASETKPEGKPPAVLIATEPMEVIVVAGAPKYSSVGDVNLLAVSNADTDVIVTMSPRAHYVVLSGRWYVSRNELQGPWTFVPPSDLPADFAKIPLTSDHAHVRAHVPDTVEAQEALLDATIPETQAIRRDDASLKVSYDGAPDFQNVEGVTAIQYAVNTPQAVFKLGARYYVCQEGVWYESAAATGPWTVSTSVPKEIYSIPTSNPHHNVTYVKVYDVTPQVVYVGYTLGYVGSYPYRGCVMYGTGWHYPGWYGSVYYPYSSTWGFRATYNPYYGWGFGIGWSSGPLTVSIGLGFGGPAYGGWWGPVGYRPYYPAYRPPYYPGYRPPYYPGYRPPGYPGYRPPVNGVRPGTPAQLPSNIGGARPSDGSIYRRGENAGRNMPSTPRTGNRGSAPTPTQRPNNVFSAPNGDVFRRNPSGQWDQRSGGNWTPSVGAGGGGGGNRPSTPTTRPTPGAGRSTGPATRPSTPAGGLNQDFGARQRGTARSSAAPKAAPKPAPRGGRR